MKSHRAGNMILCSVLATMLFWVTPAPLCAVDAQAIGENMDNYVLPVYPDIYGEILEKLPEEEIKNLKTVHATVEWFGRIQKLAEAGEKVAQGETGDALFDTLTVSAKIAIDYAKTNTGTIIIRSIEMPAIGLVLLIDAIEIAKKSHDEVVASKIALDLERLHYRVVADPALKTGGRKLAQGDPIRQDAAGVEILWRKVLTDRDFQGLFKTYVTTELGQEWPEPTLWDTITVSSQFLEDAKILEEQKRLKAHLRSLLGELNKVEKKKEAEVLLMQQLRELKASMGKISPQELAKALEACHYALQKQPEVEKYLAAIPGKVGDLKARHAKATPEDLLVIKKEIITEQVNIRLYAATVRGLPTKGRYAAARTSLLSNLKKGYDQLNGLYDTVPQVEIDRRLSERNRQIAADAARLDTGGVDFEFKRHECKKTFDDLKGQFGEKVLNGTADAEQAVTKAKDDVSRHSSEARTSYGKDFEANQKKYDEALQRLGDEIKRVSDAYNRAPVGPGKDALYTQLLRLQQQKLNLNAKFEKYRQIHASSSNIDFEDCKAVITEIDKFYDANRNRFQIVLGSLYEQVGNAVAIYNQFIQTHGTGKYNGTNNFLGDDELEKLKKLAADAPPGYAGIDLKFLKTHMRIEKEKPVSQGLVQSIKDMTDALWKYLGATNALRMAYYPTNDTSTLPCLRFMESKEARATVENVLKSLDAAIAAYGKVDPRTVPVADKAVFDNGLLALRQYRSTMEGYRKLITQASGLTTTMEKYWTRAKTQNAWIEEDSAYISALWSRFHTIRQITESTFTMARINAARWNVTLGTTPPVLTSDTIKDALEKSGMMNLSGKLGLGFEGLLTEPFAEVKAKEGFITIKTEDVNRLAGKIQGISTADLAAFYGPMHAMRKSAGAEGFLMEGYFSLGNNLWPMFAAGKGLETVGQRLRDTIAKQRETAEKNQSAADNANARFGLILGRANPAIIAVKQYIAQGQYDNALIYFTVRDDLLTQYSALNAKRADVDAALKELTDLIEEAKRRMVTGVAPAPGPMTGPVGGAMVQGPGTAQQTGEAQMAQQHAMMQQIQQAQQQAQQVQPVIQPQGQTGQAVTTPGVPQVPPQTAVPQAQQQGAPAILQTTTPAALPASVPAPAIQVAAVPTQTTPAAPARGEPPTVETPVVTGTSVPAKADAVPEPVKPAPVAPTKLVETEATGKFKRGVAAMVETETQAYDNSERSKPSPASSPVVAAPVKPADSPVVAKAPELAPVVPVAPPVAEPPKAPVSQVAAPPKVEPEPQALQAKPEPPPVAAPPRQEPKPAPPTPVVPVVESPKPPVIPAPVVAKTPASEQGAHVPAKPAPPSLPSLRDKEDVAQIRNLYQQVARAYESRTPRDVTAFFAPGWQGSDGISVSELRNTLDHMFSAYDEVRCTIQDLNISKTGDNRYKVVYEANLTLKTAKTKVKQDRKSRITEEVIVDRNTRPRIAKTLSGAPWRVK